jgi:hypothetical protein
LSKFSYAVMALCSRLRGDFRSAKAFISEARMLSGSIFDTAHLDAGKYLLILPCLFSLHSYRIIPSLHNHASSSSSLLQDPLNSYSTILKAAPSKLIPLCPFSLVLSPPTVIALLLISNYWMVSMEIQLSSHYATMAASLIKMVHVLWGMGGGRDRGKGGGQMSLQYLLFLLLLLKGLPICY